MRFATLTTACTLAWTATVQTAAAAIVSGSFAGIAQDGLLLGPGPATPTFQAEQVRGTFRIDTSLLGPQTVEGPEFASYQLLGDALLLRFTVAGTTYSFGNQGLASTATVFTGQGGQSLLFGANLLDTGFPVALLMFGGPVPDGAPGLFVQGLDLATLQPAPIMLEAASAAFQLTQDVGASLVLTELRFDAPNAVPEPAGWWLVLTGLLLCQRYRAAVMNCPKLSHQTMTVV